MNNLNYDVSDADDSVPGASGLQAAEAEPEVETTKKPSMTPLEATIVLARRGDKKVLPMLRRALSEHPELVSHYGSLALQTQESWLQLIAGKDILLAESMRLHLDTMRSELAGSHPSPLDRLLVDRILACHVQVLYFEAMETTDPTAENMRLARYRMERRDQAHRQFLSAAKMLATVRNLVARTNVIQVELLHPPVVHPPTPSTVPSAKAKQPNKCDGYVNGAIDRSDRKPGKQVNGNRMAGMLNPIVTGSDG